jgi:L-threonylcarbamoyladenylate synthase
MDCTLLDSAVTHLRRGGVVAYPTDTLYGLAVDPRSEAAVRRLFEVKQRTAGHAVPLIAADLAQACEAGILSDLARRVAQTFWPGPLSLVVPATPIICSGILAPDGSVAIRVPASPIARSLAEELGFPITATSANLSGSPATVSPVLVAEQLGSRVDMVLDGGITPGGLPSTIVDLRGSRPRLVRAGAVEWDRVLRSIQ